MKQKLLFSLLALLVSVGVVKAQVTINAPANSGELKITVAVASGTVDVPTITGNKDAVAGSSSTTSKSYTLPNDASTISYAISGNYTQLTVTAANKNVSEIIINKADLERLTATGIGLSNLTLTTATGLKDLNVSNNNLTDSDFDFSGTVLTSLDCSTNGLKGKIKIPSTLTTLKCGNNQLYDYEGATPNSVTFGTQTLISTFTTKASNKWTDLSGLPTNVNIPITDESKTTFSNFKRLDGTNWVTAGTKQNGTTKEYKFQSSSAYLYGTHQVQITNSGLSGSRTYLVNFTVAPAEFTLSKSVVDELGTLNITPVTNNIVKLGQELTLTATATDPANYAFDKFEFSGVKGSTTEASQKAEVIGPTPSDDLDKQVVSVKAYFKANAYKIILGAVAEGGTYRVIDANNKEISNGSSVAFDTELTIVPTPASKYSVSSVIVNGTPLVLTNNKYTFKVAKETEIHVVFSSTSADKKITPYYPDFCKVTVNGTVASASGTVIAGITGSVITVEVTKAGVDEIAVSKITLNDVDATKITESGGVYTATFTLAASVAEATLSVTASKLVEITPTFATTPYTYTGSANPIQYTTVPAGLTLDVVYSNDGGTTYTSTIPVNAGTYKAKYSRKADTNYAAIAETEKEYTIAPANLTLTSPTTVAVNSKNGVFTYTISGGRAAFGSKTINGTFAPNFDSDGNAVLDVASGKETTPHLITLTFRPTSAVDRDNFVTAKVEAAATVGSATVDKFTIKGTLKDNVKVTLMNGDAKIADWASSSSATVYKGTTITLIFTTPSTVELKDVMENKEGYPSLSPSPGSDANTYTVTLTNVAKNYDFILSTSAVAGKKAIEVKENTVYEAPYSGGVQVYPVANIGSYLSFNTTKTPTAVVTQYKQGNTVVTSPVNAGTYTVVLKLTPHADDASTYQETTVEATMKIKQATPTVAWPTKILIGAGQTSLTQATFEDGTASVPGKFVVIETTPPVNGNTYTLKFVPTDATNYAEVINSVKTPLEINNNRYITIDEFANGTLIVKDNNGKIYTTGEAIATNATSLTITATPATGYTLASLLVNNSNFTSGNTFTLGAASVTVKATFTSASSFKVNFKVARGVQIASKSGETAAAGKNFTFTLASAQGDVPSVEDEDGNVIRPNSSGVYTLENVLKEKTVTISLSSPTEFKVTVTESEHGTIKIENLSAATRADEFFYGDTLRLTTTPEEGGLFRKWWDGNTTNPRIYVVTKDQVISTDISPVGIEPVANLEVYGAEGYIYVSAPGEVSVTVVSMTGRSQKVRVNGTERIEVPAGIYGVNVEQGDKASRLKVVVR